MKRRATPAKALSPIVRWGVWAIAALLIILVILLVVRASGRLPGGGFGRGLVPPVTGAMPRPQAGAQPATSSPYASAQPGYPTSKPAATPPFSAASAAQEQQAIRNQATGAIISKWAELRPKYYSPQASLSLGSLGVTWDGGIRAEAWATGQITGVLAPSQLSFRVILSKYSTGWRADQVLPQGLPASPLAPTPQPTRLPSATFPVAPAPTAPR